MARALTKEDIHFTSGCHDTVYVVGDCGQTGFPLAITVDANPHEALDIGLACGPPLDLDEGSCDRMSLADYPGETLDEQMEAASASGCLAFTEEGPRWKSGNEWLQGFDTLREAGAFWRAL